MMPMATLVPIAPNNELLSKSGDRLETVSLCLVVPAARDWRQAAALGNVQAVPSGGHAVVAWSPAPDESGRRG